jgi:hypothetical protein
MQTESQCSKLLERLQSISEFQLGLRWRTTANVISLWRLYEPKKIPPHYKCGMFTRYLLADVERFPEPQNPQTLDKNGSKYPMNYTYN